MIPRQNSLVKCHMPVGHEKSYPFTEDYTYVFLGEIPNMDGHCIVAEYYSGRLFSGYHTWMFEEVPEEETCIQVGTISLSGDDMIMKLDLDRSIPEDFVDVLREGTNDTLRIGQYMYTFQSWCSRKKNINDIFYLENKQLVSLMREYNSDYTIRGWDSP